MLNSLAGADVITDFESGVDKIAISKSVFVQITGAASATAVTVEALGEAFAYDEATGALTYDADGGGVGEDAVTVARMQPGALAGDFLIIG